MYTEYHIACLTIFFLKLWSFEGQPTCFWLASSRCSHFRNIVVRIEVYIYICLLTPLLNPAPCSQPAEPIKFGFGAYPERRCRESMRRYLEGWKGVHMKVKCVNLSPALGCDFSLSPLNLAVIYEISNIQLSLFVWGNHAGREILKKLMSDYIESHRYIRPNFCLCIHHSSSHVLPAVCEYIPTWISFLKSSDLPLKL